MSFLTRHDVTGERELLAVFVEQQADQIATSLYGLSREDLGRAASASAMTLGALARHALLMVEGTVLRVEAAPEASAPAARTPEQAAAEGPIDPSALREEDTAESLAAALREAGAALGAALLAADPATSVPIPRAPWFPTEGEWTVRWVALHLVEELARHAGHADILRESLDGKGTYELNARSDGEPWHAEWAQG